MKRLALCVALAACGSDDIDTDEVAQLVGATLATPDGGGTLGAVSDSLALAFGGMPAGFTYEAGIARGFHGDTEHRYMMIVCRDVHLRVLPSCTTETDLAILNVVWSADGSERQGMWSIGNLQQWAPTVTGASELQLAADGYEILATQTERMLAPAHMMGGSLELALEVTRGSAQAELAGEVRFDDNMRSAALDLDGRSYRLDLVTGRSTIAD